MQGVVALYASDPGFESRSGLMLPRPFRLIGTCTIPCIFGNDSISAGRNCHGSIAWIECLPGMGEHLGSSPNRAMCFFLFCDIYSMTSFDGEVIEIYIIIIIKVKNT